MAEYLIGQRRSGSGILMPGISGEALLRGSAVYMSAVDGRWYLADSDALATMPVVGVSSEQTAAGRVFQIITLGLIGRASWTWTRGDPLYISGTAGILTQTAPAVNAQSIAVALTATLIYVNPQALGRPQMFEYQAPQVLNQAAPVQNTWYSFGEVVNARIYTIHLSVATTNETLECQVLIDGETIEALGLAATAGTEYAAIREPAPITRVDRMSIQASSGAVDRAFPSHMFDGKTVEVQIRKTTAAGAGALTGIVVWGQLSVI